MSPISWVQYVQSVRFRLKAYAIIGCICLCVVCVCVCVSLHAYLLVFIPACVFFAREKGVRTGRQLSKLTYFLSQTLPRVASFFSLLSVSWDESRERKEVHRKVARGVTGCSSEREMSPKKWDRNRDGEATKVNGMFGFYLMTLSRSNKKLPNHKGVCRLSKLRHNHIL